MIEAIVAVITGTAAALVAAVDRTGGRCRGISGGGRNSSYCCSRDRRSISQAAAVAVVTTIEREATGVAAATTPAVGGK